MLQTQTQMQTRYLNCVRSVYICAHRVYVRVCELSKSALPDGFCFKRVAEITMATAGHTSWFIYVAFATHILPLIRQRTKGNALIDIGYTNTHTHTPMYISYVLALLCFIRLWYTITTALPMACYPDEKSIRIAFKMWTVLQCGFAILTAWSILSCLYLRLFCSFFVQATACFRKGLIHNTLHTRTHIFLTWIPNFRGEKHSDKIHSRLLIHP